jgi:hypothetical protein
VRIGGIAGIEAARPRRRLLRRPADVEAHDVRAHRGAAVKPGIAFGRIGAGVDAVEEAELQAPRGISAREHREPDQRDQPRRQLREPAPG